MQEQLFSKSQKIRPHHTRTKNSKDNWETPPYFFKILDEIFHFTLDPCASDENHKCNYYFIEEEDGLKQSWAGEICFINPPYSNKDIWVKKAFNEVKEHLNTTCVLLIPDTTDTRIFHDIIFPYANEILFTDGRIQFLEPDTKKPIGGNPRGSAVVIFRNSPLYTHSQIFGTIKHKHLIK